MRFFHVKIGERTFASHATYEAATACALWLFDHAVDAARVEIVRASATVWGPYYKGGRYLPGERMVGA